MIMKMYDFADAKKQTQFKPNQSQFAYPQRRNKPNSNPIQNQTNPISMAFLPPVSYCPYIKNPLTL
jgi:hypothetical protein